MAGHGAYIFGCADLKLSPDERAFFRDSQPWGFILFARNVEAPDQLRRLTGDLRDAVGWHAPILIDQEGGRVQRMRAPHWREYLPALDQVRATGRHAARAMYLRNRLIAEELYGVGIDVNCAPLADVLRPETHAVLANRLYSNDLDQVIELSKQVVSGFKDGGVLPVLKHVPGYGLASVDSHLELPTVTADRDELDRLDFAAFKALNHIKMGMTSHVVYRAIDEQPATVSKPCIDMIRQEIGFDGLLMTDDISMEALEGSVAHRSERAIAAGCDIALHCNGNMAEMITIADRLTKMDHESKLRADNALKQRVQPMPVDISALEAELNSLIGGG